MKFKVQINMEMQISEIKFKEWMDHKKIIGLFFDQSIVTFPSTFFQKAKRPDFLIIPTNIFIDVKDRKMWQLNESFTVDELDFQKLKELESLSKINVFLAFSNEYSAYRTWYFFPIKMVSRMALKKRGTDNTEFRIIPITECITLGWNDDITKIIL